VVADMTDLQVPVIAAIDGITQEVVWKSHLNVT